MNNITNAFDFNVLQLQIYKSYITSTVFFEVKYIVKRQYMRARIIQSYLCRRRKHTETWKEETIQP